MAQLITNQASLNYLSNGQNVTVLSNIATTTLNDTITAYKESVETTYQQNGDISYAVSFVNSSTFPLTNVVITDNLGTYQIGTTNYTPLLLDSTALYFINGVYNGTLTATPGINNVSFTIPTVPAGANITLVYKATLNQYAPLEVESQITNTITITATELTTPVTADNTVTVDNYANVAISKGMSPATVVPGSPITYTFTLYNYGNSTASNIILSDTFDPAPTTIAVQVNGETVDPTNYTYTNGLLTLPVGTTYTLTLPTATITQNATTGVVTVVPSTMTIVVTGTI